MTDDIPISTTPKTVPLTTSTRSKRVSMRLTDDSTLDILPALKGEDSPKGILGLRVSSALKFPFGRCLTGCRPIVTEGVRSSAYSRVKAAFPPTHGGRQRRQGIQPAGEHGSTQPNC